LARPQPSCGFSLSQTVSGGEILEQLIKEFSSWNKENQKLYHELEEHDSPLYDRFQVVYEVLSYLEKMITSGELKPNDDLDRIFMVGLEYLSDQFYTLRLYLETNFHNNLHELLKYDTVINAVLFIEDLRYEIKEQGIKTDEKAFDDLSDELEKIITDESAIPDNFKLYVDDVIHKAIGDQKFTFNGIIDIFHSIAETLGIFTNEENEVVLGKDI